ncbi:MAG TPA: hypothetical protein VLJ59_16955 [Mycobacteriales bacterium]|nr:hypothetical protein [Mycobacteriales bacterium]
MLTGAGGEFLADHEVDLAADAARRGAGWEGFTDFEWSCAGAPRWTDRQ